MKELLRTNDVVLLSFLQARLGQAGIEPIVLDANASIVEGSIGILPRRLMVIDEDYDLGLRTVVEAQKEAEQSQRDE